MKGWLEVYVMVRELLLLVVEVEYERRLIVGE